MKNIFFIFLIVFFGAIGAFALNACVSSTPAIQYPADTSIAMVYSYDDTDKVKSTEIPSELQQQLDQSMTQRNLKVQPVPFASVSTILDSIRDTERRLNALETAAGNANYMVLTELSTEFYSPLSGRYRWDVRAKMTIIDMRTHETLTQSFTLPAVLMYSHETGADALNSVRADLERKLTSLVDQFLKGLLNGVQTKTVAEAPRGASPGKARTALSEKSEAIYFIMVDRFFNASGDNDKDVNLSDPAGWHGGDLAGIRQKLPYLKSLGITQLWLSPVFTAAHDKFFGNGAFHGYWTYDLNSTDPSFGSIEDLKQLAAEAKKNNIGIILDFVVNHVGYGSPLVEQKPSWFHEPKTIEDWNDPYQLTHYQVHGLPDLAQENPEVYQYLSDAAQKWIEIPNITGYRLDAVKHVEMDFWKKFNTGLKAKKSDIMLLGEYFDGNPKKVDEVQKNGNFTHLFDFPLAFALRDVYCDHKTLDYLANIFPNDNFYSNPNNMVTFLDNHDMPRFISKCNGDEAAMIRALNVMLSLRGIPALYYGTEVPLSGSEEPANRADMNFESQKFYTEIQTALNRRATYPVLRDGKTGVLHFEPDFIIVARDNDIQQAVILISESNVEKNYTLPAGNWFDADSREQVSRNVTVAPKSVRILINKDHKKNIIISGTRKIQFTLPGDDYAIVGSSPELGQWNPQNAIHPTNGTVTVELPAQSVIVYKPIKINADHSVQWADGPNRAVFTETQSAVNVQPM